MYLSVVNFLKTQKSIEIAIHGDAATRFSASWERGGCKRQEFQYLRQRNRAMFKILGR